MRLIDGTLTARRAVCLARVLTLLVDAALEEARATCRIRQHIYVVHQFLMFTYLFTSLFSPLGIAYIRIRYFLSPSLSSSSLLSWRPITSIFTKFSEWVHIWVGMINPTIFSRSPSPKGRRYVKLVTDFWRESAKIGIPHHTYFK